MRLRFGDAVASGKVLAPAKTLDEMSRIVFNDYVDATLAALFAAIVVAMVVYGVMACSERCAIRAARRSR